MHWKVVVHVEIDLLFGAGLPQQVTTFYIQLEHVFFNTTTVMRAPRNMGAAVALRLAL